MAATCKSDGVYVGFSRRRDTVSVDFGNGPFAWRRPITVVSHLAQTLFGGASLVAQLRRIGTKGRAKVETFDENQEVDVAVMRLELAKRRRSYVDLNAAGTKLPR